MTFRNHAFEGCRPRPLASYLKALGVLRLVSLQKDNEVRGYWRAGHFWLVTRLSAQELERFLLEEYSPTPLVAPWNGGSGFYPKDNTTAIDAIQSSRAARLDRYREAIALCRRFTEGLEQAPKGDVKFRVQRQLIETAPTWMREWMAAVFVIGSDGEPDYPAILGTGGNDGRFDFTNNFMQRLVALFDCDDVHARPTREAVGELSRSLWAVPGAGSHHATMGQFDPGSVSGANFGNGFRGQSVTNCWDYVLLLEGCLTLSASATRRLAVHAPSRAAAPFAVHSAAGGYASASSADELCRGEQWFPVWSSPASYAEVRSLFSEGRATLKRHAAQGAMDFALSISRLGVARGVDAFERYGYIERNGQANLAVPLGRWVVGAKPHLQLLDEVDGWVQRIRTAAGAKGAPQAFARHARALQDAVFLCCQQGRTRDWQQLWFALGAAEHQLTRSPRFVAERGLQPLPALNAEWIQAIDDGHPSCRIAVALGMVRDPEHVWGLRTYWLPLENRYRPRFLTDSAGLAFGPEQVVRGEDAMHGLGRVVLRRGRMPLSDRAVRSHGSLALGHTGPSVRLADITGWLAGDISGFDLMAWLPAALAIGRDAGPALREHFVAWDDRHSPASEVPVPPVFALLRTAVPHEPPTTDEPQVRFDPAILSALHARHVARAASTAIRRLRAAGLLPLLQRASGPRSSAMRLLSAMLFPLSRGQLRQLVRSVTRSPIPRD